MKKILLMLLFLVMLLSLSVPVFAENSSIGLQNFVKTNTYSSGMFKDVKDEEWYSSNVKIAYELGLVKGSGPTSFNPLGNITIAETLAIACRLHSIYYTGAANFTQGSLWYQVYVEYAKANGIISNSQFEVDVIVNGISSTVTRYTDNATRAEFASILSKAIDASALKAVNSIDAGMIPDVDTSSTYSNDIYLLYRAGILTGNDSKGTFTPDTFIQRSAVATIVTRMADISLRKVITLKSPCNHSWDSGIITMEATCVNTGVKTYTCKLCSETKIDVLSKTAHSYSGSKCTICGAINQNYDPTTLIYQDSRVKIYFKKVTSSGIIFEVENFTTTTITIQADAISINGKSTENITMSDDVAPMSVGEVIARCSFDQNEAVGTISGQLSVIDFNRSFRSYDALFANVCVDDSISTSTQVSGLLLYSDSRVKIYYKETTSSGVIFTVQNLTGILITIQADSISINRHSTDNITMSDDIAPYSTGDVFARCSVGITSGISSIGGTLRIIDFNNSFRSYDATFINVPIN